MAHSETDNFLGNFEKNQKYSFSMIKMSSNRFKVFSIYLFLGHVSADLSELRHRYKHVWSWKLMQKLPRLRPPAVQVLGSEPKPNTATTNKQTCRICDTRKILNTIIQPRTVIEVGNMWWWNATMKSCVNTKVEDNR